MTNQLVLRIGYDRESLLDPKIKRHIKGKYLLMPMVDLDRNQPSTINLDRHTSSTKLITDAVLELFERIVDKNL